MLDSDFVTSDNFKTQILHYLLMKCNFVSRWQEWKDGSEEKKPISHHTKKKCVKFIQLEWLTDKCVLILTLVLFRCEPRLMTSDFRAGDERWERARSFAGVDSVEIRYAGRMGVKLKGNLLALTKHGVLRYYLRNMKWIKLLAGVNKGAVHSFGCLIKGWRWWVRNWSKYMFVFSVSCWIEAENRLPY